MEDMRFTQSICREWGIELYLFQEDCPRLAAQTQTSLETAARQFRYACFEELFKTGKADFVATAHHQGDEAETVLFRLARGSALTGAVAIKEENGRYIRPFLDWSKEKILAYVREKGLFYREDSTNTQLDATRNKLRLEVLPKLEEAVPNARENLARFAALAAEDEALLQRLSAPLLAEYEGLPFVQFSKEKPLFTRACLAAMKEAGLQKDYTSAHLQALFDLQSLETGSVIVLPQGVRARRERTGVVFYREKEEERILRGAEKAFSLEGFDGGKYILRISFAPPQEKNSWRVLRADLDKIPQDARVRFRGEGDYIYRFGGGKKSLKKFFNEEKIPVKEREYLPLIALDKEVLAVGGVEISQKIAVDSATEREIYIWIERKGKDDGNTP